MKRIQIDARGMKFDALSDGPEDGPLVLMLHGLPRTSWEWHHQIPKLAETGYRAVAPDLRGYCAGARPEGVEAYVVGEFAADILAIADELGWADRPFHLMGTSIGSVVAWRLAAENPHRVGTLTCINIPHPGAFAEVYASEAAEKQRQGMAYIANSRKEGNERKTFAGTLKHMDLPAEETDPYREAIDSDEAFRAVFNWYRALPLWNSFHSSKEYQPLPPVTMPTMFIWPPKARNVSQESAEANANYCKGPYRFEILESARNFALQKEPETIARLLLAHLADHAR